MPIHFHTHDTSGINAASILKAADAGVDVADGGDRVDERHDQPAESEFDRGGAGEYATRHRSSISTR